MTPSQQQAKDMQDEARREQQADERIRELERENERLRNHMHDALGKLDYVDRRMQPADFNGRHRLGNVKQAFDDAQSDLKSALDGGGDDHASS